MKEPRSPRKFGRALAIRRALVRATLMPALLLGSAAATAAPLTVTVKDPGTGASIKGANIVIYRVAPDGKLRRVRQRRTSANGQTRVELAGLGRGTDYVVKASYQDRRLSTERVNRAGRVQFHVTADGRGMRDRTRPFVRIASAGGRLNPNGFSLKGRAWDDSLVKRVDVIVKDPVLGNTRQKAKLNRKRGVWTVRFPAGQVTPGERVEIVARAVDRSGRQRRHVINKRVAGGGGDGQGEGQASVQIKRPVDGSTVSADGFRIAGVVRRAKRLRKLTVSVEDHMLGVSVEERRVRVNRRGVFRFPVMADYITEGGTATITLRAIDRKGNDNVTTFTVNVGEGAGGGGDDTTGPDIMVSDPVGGSEVSADGFAITGTATDPSGIASVTATLRDAESDTEMSLEPTVDGKSGEFSATAPAGILTPGGSASLTIMATDTASNTSTQVVPLMVAAGPDVEGPAIVATTPGEGATVALEGFTIYGNVSDPAGVASLTIGVTGAADAVRLAPTAVTPDASGNFMVAVPPAGLIADETLTISFSATDSLGNASAQMISVTVSAADTAGPEFAIDSPADAGTVGIMGFTLSGRVSDSAGVASATWSVTRDGTPLIDTTDIDAGEDGSFSIPVELTGVSENEALAISLNATDGSGNTSTQTINVTAREATSLATSTLLARTTFGATPELMDQVNASGIEAFINEQLNPATIDNSTFDSFLNGFQPGDRDELRYYSLVHMVSSRRQLQEVMTQFWDNHFNTFIYASSGDFDNTPAYELRENNLFRENALGRFRDLLNVSATSPSMLIYLDNVVNRRSNANENYARELLELHTLGVNGGYTQEDIEAAAEIFTGWHLNNDQFSFNSDEHNSDAQTFMGVDIASGGVEQGQQLLDILANSPATAQYICTKLSQLLVADDPSDTIISRCADTFIANTDASNQVALVLRTILESPEFAASAGAKIKTPLEFLTSAIRGLTAIGDGSDLPWMANQLGMVPFDMPVPTGWSETGDDWMNTNQIVERIKWAQQLSQRNGDGSRTGIDPVAWVTARNLSSTTEIVSYLIDFFVAGNASATARQALIDTLDEGGAFDLSANDADQKLRHAIGLTLSLPGFHFQ